jgi:hypothetical protein
MTRKFAEFLELQKVEAYLPKDDGMKKAFTGADIVVIPAGIPRTCLLLSPSSPRRRNSQLTTNPLHQANPA